ncbi:MAG: hypothetical protein CEN91_396 [Candidatus Berkelbacteria bacterium Licking1014_85]|uniref:Uncharacterized protein n=1 Tax=Candidatus Berkelbacteria bacterium Licking1014_85 TaxID=2017148 RepID=A0A554LIB5_9BACT|nr:MAG: hypothetical protein CEN91_396 [Candidatus Berkelbacteria bacterium Licking1014_85]
MMEGEVESSTLVWGFFSIEKYAALIRCSLERSIEKIVVHQRTFDGLFLAIFRIVGCFVHLAVCHIHGLPLAVLKFLVDLFPSDNKLTVLASENHREFLGYRDTANLKTATNSNAEVAAVVYPHRPRLDCGETDFRIMTGRGVNDIRNNCFLMQGLREFLLDLLAANQKECNATGKYRDKVSHVLNLLLPNFGLGIF